MKAYMPLQQKAPKTTAATNEGKTTRNPLQLKEKEAPLQGKQPLLAAARSQNPLQLIRERTRPNGNNPLQRKENKTGLPDHLKAGVEALSGYSMDDVKVHYNSSRPAQINALAYAQGTNIHIAPGQEKHLPHEAWHVVQQKQGRVKASMQMKGGEQVNDDSGLEAEATRMGEKIDTGSTTQAIKAYKQESNSRIIQRTYSTAEYRINKDTRKIHIEEGDFKRTNNPKEQLDRAVLFETMVPLKEGQALAKRYDSDTNKFRDAVGLTVALNASYRDEKERKTMQTELTKTAKTITDNTTKSSINIVKVLWQDGRKNQKEDIREEVPFSELRKHAATDRGSLKLYEFLQRQAKVVWRKMGDDDMPFKDPNDKKDEVNKKLLEAEDRRYKASLITFSYTLKPVTDNENIKNIISSVYTAEAMAIEEIKQTYSKLKTYPIEPTTYYKGLNTDVADAWNEYENQVVEQKTQIKEGAWFAKSLIGKRNTDIQYIKLDKPIETGSGPRLIQIVNLLQDFFNNPKEGNVESLMGKLKTSLQELDQSIWDMKTLTRGAEWMSGTESDKQYLSGSEKGINEIIDNHFKKLIDDIKNLLSNYVVNRNHHNPKQEIK